MSGNIEIPRQLAEQMINAENASDVKFAFKNLREDILENDRLKEPGFVRRIMNSKVTKALAIGGLTALALPTAISLGGTLGTTAAAAGETLAPVAEPVGGVIGSGLKVVGKGIKGVWNVTPDWLKGGLIVGGGSLAIRKFTANPEKAKRKKKLKQIRKGDAGFEFA